MFQPKDADIRRDPCRMPVGPNRAPGLAVTAFCLLGDINYSHPVVPRSIVGNSSVTFLTGYASRWGLLTVSKGAPMMAISYGSIWEGLKQLT